MGNEGASMLLAQIIAQRMLLENLMFAVFRGQIEAFNPYAEHVLGLADAIGDKLVEEADRSTVARATLASVEDTLRLVRKMLEDD